jgi:hypothetical protein
MQVNRGDVVTAYGHSWRVESVGRDGVCISSLVPGSADERWINNDEIESNLTEQSRLAERQRAAHINQQIQLEEDQFNQRLLDGDLSALAQLTDAERMEFEAKTWQLFFQRHIGVADCQATRSMLTSFLNGDFVSLAGLEQGLSKLRDKLPARQL